ncbi:MAG: SDR family NAD(P)-dependent oxidoreductase, partial [Bryobacteraceae bacterium]
MPADLANKVAIVTGGARGIGAATAVELARHGADVTVCDIRPEAAAEDVLRQIRDSGRRALFFQADVADRAAVERTVAETAERLGRLDIMVNNAAQNVRRPLLELESADVERVWHTIVMGAFHCSQLAARRMVAQGDGGNIVTISSVHACLAFRDNGPY